MFKKSALIQIEDIDTFLWYKNKFQNIKNINIDLKNRNLYLILEGERVYIKLLTLPKTSAEQLYKMIKYELKYYFNHMEEILFDYYIYKKLEKSYEVIVFCINSRKLNNLKHLLNKEKRLKLVNPIQFVIFNYAKNYIAHQEYTLIFIYKENLYMMCIKNGVLIENSMTKNFSGSYENFLLEFQRIIQIYDNASEEHNVYLLWFPYKHIIEEISKMYNCIILDYKEEDVMENIMKDWKCKGCIR